MWKDSFEMIDFHSHILAGVDDGAPDMQTSLAMLAMLSSQGIDKVVSTSHYYNSVEDVASFLARRDEALFRLESHIKEHDIYLPDIACGAEVRVYSGLWQEPQLNRLCIGDSRKILVEMPYDRWSDWMFGEIYSLTAKGYTPIIAHIERYIDMIPAKVIEESLLCLDVMVQCNADFVSRRSQRRFVKKLIDSGAHVILGSDCHNMTSRPPRMSEAFAYISKKFGDDCLKYMMDTASAITNEK